MLLLWYGARIAGAVVNAKPSYCKHTYIKAVISSSSSSSSSSESDSAALRRSSIFRVSSSRAACFEASRAATSSATRSLPLMMRRRLTDDCGEPAADSCSDKRRFEGVTTGETGARLGGGPVSADDGERGPVVVRLEGVRASLMPSPAAETVNASCLSASGLGAEKS